MDTALTVPVNDLSSSTQFYLAALKPLGYCFISHVQHDTGHANTSAVGLGPEGTTRVDLFLSQSRGGRRRSPNNRVPHVVFPASARHVVRDFYAAALGAGGRPVDRPGDREDGRFAATVADLDGNKIDVNFEKAPASSDIGGDAPAAMLPSTQHAGGSIQQWRESISHTVPASATRDGSNLYERSTSRGRRPPSVAMSAQAPARSNSRRSDTAARPSASPPADAAGGNKVVGTIIGAAAGAALAYTMVRSKQDSSSKERDFASRMAAKERLREEARQYAAKIDRARDVRRRSHADRDSGYYSENQPPPAYREKSPTTLVHRSTTYPQGRERGRSEAKRVLEYAPRTSSPTAYSQGTVRPPQRSQSNRGRDREREGSYVTRRLSSPSKYGPPPSLPPLPASMSRKDTKSSQERARSRHTIPSVKERPPSSYHQPPHRSDVAPRTSRAASAHSSTHTAVYAPLPPASAAPSAALTAKSLSKHDRARPDVDRGALDELKTVVPDDSISCVPYPEERRERSGKRGTSWVSDGRSRTSRHSRDGRRVGVAAA